MPDSKLQRHYYLFAALAGTLALLSIDLLFPLNWDNEIFQSMAMDLIRFGRLPYLGSWAHDFPGTVYMQWLSIMLFGNSDFGFRSFDMTLHLGMAWMFYSLLCHWLSPRTACLAVLLYMLHYISDAFIMASQRDEFATAFLLIGTILLFAAAKFQKSCIPKYLAAIGAGVALTTMLTFRATYGTFALVGIVFFLLQSEDRIYLVVSYMIGVTCLLSALLIPYAIHHGGIEQAYLIIVRYNLEIYGEIREPFKIVVIQIMKRKLFFLPAFAGILLAFRSSLRRTFNINRLWRSVTLPKSSERWLFVGYCVCGLISLLVMGKFLPYHFEPIMLVVLPFAALGIESLIAAIPGRPWRITAISALCLYAFLRVYPLFLVRPFANAIMTGEPIEIAKNNMTSAEAGFRRNVDVAAASYIDETAPSGNCVACATLTAGVRLRTTRLCVSRFTTFYPLSMSAPDGSHPDFQQAWRIEFIDSLLIERPYYIVLGNGPAEVVDWVHKPPSQCIHEIEGFDSLIMPHYKIDTNIGGYSILRRSD